MSNLIGSTLGQYEIKALLGEGGMATVYRATQASMNRDVAIKIMSAELSDNEEFISRFEREAQFFATLQHPHILPIIDFGKSDKHIFIVMRLVEWGGLDELIRQGALSLPITVQMVNQIASALAFAHNKGVIHRDLKPNNVLLDEARNCYLTDFGLARLAHGTTRLTRTDAIMGTPSYMAPEQWTGSKVDSRADIYALGVMIYEMVTGKLPFEGDTSYVLMYKHINEEPVKPGEHMKDLPRQVEDVVLRALAKDPDERFQSAESLAHALRDAAEGRTPISIVAVGSQATEETMPSQATKPAQSARDTKPGESDTVLPDEATIVGIEPLLPKPKDGATLVDGYEQFQPITRVAGQEVPIAQTLLQSRRSIIGVAVIIVVAVVVVVLSRGGSETESPVAAIPENLIDLASIPGRLSYNRSTTESQDIYAMNPDGSDLQFIGTGGKPSWSFDGEFIAFDSSFTGDPELFLISTDGKEMRNLTKSPDSQEYYASFSPDGTQIVYHSDRNGNFDIYILNLEDGTQRQITDNVANDQWPAWSPDAERIAFTSQRDGNLEIYVMDADGDNLRRITENPAADLWVAWAPDGTQLGFQSNRDGNLEIYVMNADGTNTRRLTNNEADDQWPDWSPNGYIAFSSNRDGNQEIYLIHPDGTGLTRVTNNNTDERFPVWSKHAE